MSNSLINEEHFQRVGEIEIEGHFKRCIYHDVKNNICKDFPIVNMTCHVYNRVLNEYNTIVIGNYTIVNCRYYR